MFNAFTLQVIKPYNAHEAQGNAVLQVELPFLLPRHPNDLATFEIFIIFFQVLVPMTRFVLDLLLLLLVVQTKLLRDKELRRCKHDIQ